MKPIMTPSIFCLLVEVLKKDKPTSMVNKGVSEFKMPAKELSILVSAIQKRKEGIKLPKNPDKKTMPIFSLGIFLKAVIAKGSKTSPENSILIEAT
jgi:hypothetical protein